MTQKSILITGATDGIGLVTARALVSSGQHVLLHGRNTSKLKELERTLAALPTGGRVESYVADLSRMADVEVMAEAINARYTKLDVLINNAGVYGAPETITDDGLDIRFAVNTIAPFLLTQRLLPLLNESSRVVNLSSAAQAPVKLDALSGQIRLHDDFTAYAQSKLAITMWSRSMGLNRGDDGPLVVSVNPGSMLATKMVKQAFGVAGADVAIGADILTRASLSEEFESASGKYFDNDAGQFASPHPDALDPKKTEAVVDAIEAVLSEKN